MISLLLLALLSFSVGLIGFVLGGGFGTILTPLLILLGFDPILAVFLVLTAQFFGETVAMILHHVVGNANFNHGSSDTKHGLVLGVCGVVGIVGVIVALSVGEVILVVYNASILLLLGSLVLFAKPPNTNRLSLRKVMFIGSLASINKALTGGNYGPTILAGSILLGGDVKRTIAIISMAETVACGVAVLGYMMSGVMIGLDVLIFAIVGTVLSVFPSVLFVKRTPNNKLKKFVGSLMVILGLLLLLRTF